MTWDDVIAIRAMRKDGVPVRVISEQTGFHSVSIYGMLKKGDDWEPNDNYRPWTQDEMTLLTSDRAKGMSPAAIGRELNRTSGQVRAQLRTLKNKGFDTGRGNHTRAGYYNPNNPGQRTLLARTCAECGKFLPAKFFKGRKGNTKHNSGTRTCIRCLNSKRNNAKSTNDRLQAATLETAVNIGKEWVASDDEYLREAHERNEPLVVSAIKLGRTYYSVSARAVNIGLEKRPSLGDPDAEQWRILFPAIYAASE